MLFSEILGNKKARTFGPLVFYSLFNYLKKRKHKRPYVGRLFAFFFNNATTNIFIPCLISNFYYYYIHMCILSILFFIFFKIFSEHTYIYFFYIFALFLTTSFFSIPSIWMNNSFSLINFTKSSLKFF